MKTIPEFCTQHDACKEGREWALAWTSNAARWTIMHAGRPDPAAAMARLAQLEWVPITERLPELDDADEFEDVEWSDGRDIWQGNYKDDDTATHWRSITLP